MNTTCLPMACIIVHYGSPEPTQTCLASLAKTQHRPWILVICNTPDTESAELLALVRNDHPHLQVAFDTEADALQSDICFVSLAHNAGFAAACNVGLKLAQCKPELRYAWLLNNDTIVASDAPLTLLNCLEAHPKAICGTSVFRMDKPDLLELALGCRFSPLTTILTRCHASKCPEQVLSSPTVDYVYGASMAFSLSALEKVGFFDEQFFLYYEEHDFCLRAARKGYTFVWCREASVWHGYDKSCGQANDEMVATKQHHEARSTTLFILKNFKQFLSVALAFRTVGKLVISVRKGNFSNLKIHMKSTAETLCKAR